MYEGPVPSQEKRQGAFQLQTRDLAKAREVISRAAAVWNDDTHIVQLPAHALGHELLKQLVDAGVRVDAWQPHKPTLEEFYLDLTGA
jgi:ABC-2 type transport system ATP-binding protein